MFIIYLQSSDRHYFYFQKNNLPSIFMRCIRQIMQPGKIYRRACFAWAKDATASFA